MAGFCVDTVRRRHQAEQHYILYAGLDVMALVVLKLFLWDLWGLDGIFRILSFMGLGLCLIGMRWICNRFAQKAKVG